MNDPLNDKLDEQKDLTQPNSTPCSIMINNQLAFPIETHELGQHFPSLPQEQVIQNQVMNENLEVRNDYKDIHPIGTRFIKIISDSLNLQEMKSSLEPWKEKFSKLSCVLKVRVLKTIESKRKFNFFDNNSEPSITLAAQHLSSCFQETFLTLGKPIKDKHNIPTYVETFSRLLLNSGWLESIVHELLSKIHDPSIYTFIQSFLSSNIQEEWKSRAYKDFSWQSTSIVYAYLVYSYQSCFSQSKEPFPINQTTLLNRANQTMQQLKQQLESEKNQNKKKAGWFSLLQAAKERYEQKLVKPVNQMIQENQMMQELEKEKLEKEKRINQIMQELEKDPDYFLILKAAKERYDVIVNK